MTDIKIKTRGLDLHYGQKHALRHIDLDIEKNKVRGDLGITYDSDVLRLIDAFRSKGLYVGSVVVTQYTGQAAADSFRLRLEKLGVRVYRHYSIQGYPHNIAHIVSDEEVHPGHVDRSHQGVELVVLD